MTKFLSLSLVFTLFISSQVRADTCLGAQGFHEDYRLMSKEIFALEFVLSRSALAKGTTQIAYDLPVNKKTCAVDKTCMVPYMHLFVGEYLRGRRIEITKKYNEKIKVLETTLGQIKTSSSTKTSAQVELINLNSSLNQAKTEYFQQLIQAYQAAHKVFQETKKGWDKVVTRSDKNGSGAELSFGKGFAFPYDLNLIPNQDAQKQALISFLKNGHQVLGKDTIINRIRPVNLFMYQCETHAGKDFIEGDPFAVSYIQKIVPDIKEQDYNCKAPVDKNNAYFFNFLYPGLSIANYGDQIPNNEYPQRVLNKLRENYTGQNLKKIKEDIKPALKLYLEEEYAGNVNGPSLLGPEFDITSDCLNNTKLETDACKGTREFLDQVYRVAFVQSYVYSRARQPQGEVEGGSIFNFMTSTDDTGDPALKVDGYFNRGMRHKFFERLDLAFTEVIKSFEYFSGNTSAQIACNSNPNNFIGEQNYNGVNNANNTVYAGPVATPTPVSNSINVSGTNNLAMINMNRTNVSSSGDPKKDELSGAKLGAAEIGQAAAGKLKRKVTRSSLSDLDGDYSASGAAQDAHQGSNATNTNMLASNHPQASGAQALIGIHGAGKAEEAKKEAEKNEETVPQASKAPSVVALPAKKPGETPPTDQGLDLNVESESKQAKEVTYAIDKNANTINKNTDENIFRIISKAYVKSYKRFFPEEIAE